MPILDMQRQFRELGRLRLGHQVEFKKNGKTLHRPEKLKTWRLTSPRSDLLERAAEVYGGDVVPWPDGPDGDAFQIITTTDELDIVMPPGRPLDQWNELWGGGGCIRRCDGRDERLSGQPCPCKAEYPELSARTDAAGKGEACKPTTRLQVILPRLPDIGTWLLVSHSYYAAVELAGTAELLMRAREAGRLIEARLWIDQRTVKRPGQPTRQFPVPAIRIPETFHELMAPTAPVPQIEASGRPALPPGPPLPEDATFREVDDDEAADEYAAAQTEPPAQPVCEWRLDQGKGTTLVCGLPPHGKDVEHSWIALAMTSGGRVLPPAEAVTA